jgi:hypothetical protein
MSSCGGLNDFKTVPVPLGNGFGAALDVSDLIAKKTIYLSGPFEGEYVILGSHDGVLFVPIASFEGQEARFGTSGPQTVRRDIEFTLKEIKVERAANKTVNISIAGQDTCPCS